jgi:hypothetical protein
MYAVMKWGMKMLKCYNDGNNAPLGQEQGSKIDQTAGP